MDTRFSATIGRAGSITCFCEGANSLAELLANLADSFAYYRITADWHDMRIKVQEYCRLCNGCGEVVRKTRGRGSRFKRCPACKGKPIVSESTADVAPMSETTCVKLRDQQRAALAAWEKRTA